MLSTTGGYISTTGLVPHSFFAPLINYTAAISTTFFKNNAGFLGWNNTAFTNGTASFCSSGTAVYAVFDGRPDFPGCYYNLTIGLIPMTEALATGSKGSSVMNEPMTGQTGVTGSMAITGTMSSSSLTSDVGSVSTDGAIAIPIGGYASTSNEPVLTGGKSTIVASIESCLNYCSGYTYFGVSQGSCMSGSLYHHGLTELTYR